MSPEHVLTSNVRGLLARTLAASIGVVRGGAAKVRRGDRRQQLTPPHAPLVADDVDAWDPGALDDVITLGRGLDARHVAHIATQLAANAELVVAVFVEELQNAGLQCLHDAAAATADVRQAAHRLRADAVPR